MLIDFFVQFLPCLGVTSTQCFLTLTFQAFHLFLKVGYLFFRLLRIKQDFGCVGLFV